MNKTTRKIESSTVIWLLCIAIFSMSPALAQITNPVNSGPGDYLAGCAGAYTPCTANDVNIIPNSYKITDAAGNPLSCLSCVNGVATANLQVKYECTANERYNLYFLFYIGSTPYRVCLDDYMRAADGIQTANIPITWNCNEPLILTGPTDSSACGGPVVAWDQQVPATCDEKPLYDKQGNIIPGSTNCYTGSKCQCYTPVTVTAPCRPVATNFAICQGTTINDALFAANGAVGVGTGCTVTYTHSINKDVAGTYPYTITVTSGSCTSAANGLVTVNPLPKVSLNSAAIVAGETATLTADTTGTVCTGALAYKWYKDNVLITGATSSSYQTSTAGTYKVEVTCSATGCMASASGTVTVGSPNMPPDAVDDVFSTNEDTTLTVPAPGVLGNDTDGNGDTLTVTANTAPSHGTVTVNADGSLTYVPNANYSGTDSFTYTITDGKGGSDSATVTIIIKPVNDAPNAVDDTASVDEDNPVVITVLGNDTDPEGNPLTVTEVSDPAGGSVVINPDGTITYTPDANFCGTDSFSYTVSDGNGGTDSATVTVTVACLNDAPDAVDDAATADENTAVDITVLQNDADPDGDVLTVTTVSDPANGLAVINADGTVTYTPDAGFSGQDTFTYTITDEEGLTDTATVTVTVNSVNEAPVAVDDTYSTNEDTTLTVPAPGVLGNDVDSDGDALTVTANTNPGYGTLAVNADGSLTYTPNANYSGTDSFTYTITDGSETATATVTIIIKPVNDAPTAGDDTASVDEDNPVIIPVLGNDSRSRVGSSYRH